MNELLLSRKFWACVVTLLVIIVASFIPGFDLDADHAAGFAIVIVAYIVGVSVDPGPGGWRGVLVSRKFWAATIGFMLMWFDAFHMLLPFSLTPEQVISVAVVIGGYISGIALEQPKLVR